ncbi:MAG TPA: hypothetical protein VJG90_02305 [Candidatus Nanoarchaeia archaeon]|nr:hypothetical protein [Candidatus Nanoarchaeia archaeon]
MEIVMDSSSVILLAKTTTLETAMRKHQIEITNEVLSEIMQGKKFMCEDALLVQRLNESGTIKIANHNEKLTHKLMQNFGIEIGEASTISAAIEKNKIVATDDRQGRKTAKINGLKVTGSIGIIIGLFKDKKIKYEKAMSALNTLTREGYFNPYLIEKAKEEITK